MQTLTPLAAFQLLLLTLAVGVVIDARKEPTPWRYIMYGVAAFLAFAGVFSDWIGNKWPTTLPAMQSLGGSPIVWFVGLLSFYFVTRPYWKSSLSTSVVSPAGESYRPDYAAELERLDAVQKGVVQHVGQLAERINHLDSDLQKAQAIVHLLHKAARAERTIQMITEARPMIEDALNSEIRALSERGANSVAHIEIANGYHRTLNEIPGYQNPEFEELVAERQKKIENNALFCVLKDNESGFFRDEADKQAYYISRERIVCIQERLDQLEREARNDIAFARQ